MIVLAQGENRKFERAPMNVRLQETRRERRGEVGDEEVRARGGRGGDIILDDSYN